MANLMKDNQTLVVGGCGYFGSRIVRWLAVEEHVPAQQLSVIDLTQPSAHRRITDVNYFEADITDRSTIARLISDLKPSIIIHAASPLYNRGTFDSFMLNNVEGTRNLLDAAVAEPSSHVFIYISSSSVIHDYISDLSNANETSPLLFYPEQRQPYHHSKAIAEKLALIYNRKREDFVIAAIRPSTMFGPNEPRMIPAMVERAKKGTLRYQIGAGTNIVDFTFVDNTVLGVVLTVEALLESLQTGGDAVPEDMRVEGEAFTITNDVHSNFWDFARQVGAAAGYPTDPTRIVSVPAFIGLGVATIVEWLVWLFSFGTKTSEIKRSDLHYSTITRTFDITKAKERLGYRPRVSLEEGIRLAVAPLETNKKDA